MDAKGRRRVVTKLTEDSVREIRRLWAWDDLLQREVAQMFGISQTTVGFIVCGGTWGLDACPRVRYCDCGARRCRSRRSLAPGTSTAFTGNAPDERGEEHESVVPHHRITSSLVVNWPTLPTRGVRHDLEPVHPRSTLPSAYGTQALRREPSPGEEMSFIVNGCPIDAT
jgi:hypothetical protein